VRRYDDPEKAAIALRDRKRAYQLTANQPAGQEVIADLAAFCFAYESTFDPDHRVQALKEGRRQVWLRIQQHLKLSDDDLYRIATGGYVPPILEDTDE
jgi:hypothetical protein